MEFNQSLFVLQKELNQGNLQACLEIMDPLFEVAEQEAREDEKYENHTFEEPVQEFIYSIKKGIQKPIQNVPNNYGRFFKMAAIVEYQLGNVSVAKANLKESLWWNPCDLETRLLEAELYKTDLKMYKEKNLELLEYAYKREFIAQIYMNLSSCFEEETVKAYCLYYAHYFDSSLPGLEEAVKEIACKTGIQQYPDEKELSALFSKYQIPKAPDQELMSILFNMGLNFESRKNYPVALYGFKLLYELNLDDMVLKKIQELKKAYGETLYPACREFFENPVHEKYVQVIQILACLDVLVPVKKDNPREFVILRGEKDEIAIPVFYEIAQTHQQFGEDVLLERMDIKDLASVVLREENLAALVYNPFSEYNIPLRKDVLNYIIRV
ncbi:MAG: SseB family protein [Bacillota bacterium]|nr:SseB family protein [Bacillota bacterium]